MIYIIGCIPRLTAGLAGRRMENMPEPAGYSKRLEAIQIQLYPKNASNAPAQTTRSYIANTEAGTLTYASFVEGSGWQNAVSAGTISGTTGQGKQLEAVKINLENVKDGLKGGIQYSACLETGGWQNWVNGGAVAGVAQITVAGLRR